MSNGAIITTNSLSLNLSLGNSFYFYLQKINKIPSLTPEEEFLLAHNYLENNDINAAQKLVTSHLKLVAKIAFSYRHYGLPLIELISEGNIGLIHAVKKYKPELGFRLSTYAIWWIKATIQEYILKSWSLIKIGTTAAQKKIFFSLNRIKQRLYNLHARNIQDEDYQLIADKVGVSKQEVSDIDQRLSREISLNQTSPENGLELINLISETKPNQEIILVNKQESLLKSSLLHEAISNVLDEREIIIFKRRRLEDSPDTLDKLGKKFSVSKERIRQIEAKAFSKIKAYILDKYKKIQKV